MHGCTHRQVTGGHLKYIYSSARRDTPDRITRRTEQRTCRGRGGGEKVPKKRHSLSHRLAVDPLEAVKMSSFNKDRQKPGSEEGRLHADKCSVRGGISAQTKIQKKYTLA